MTDKVAVEIVEEETKDILVTTSTGAVVKVLETPAHLLQRVWEKYPEPKVPQQTIKEGDREWVEDNPDDPDYLAAVEARTLNVYSASSNIILLKGIEVVSLPEGVSDFDHDKAWIEEYEVMMLDIPESRAARYLEWIRYRVAPRIDDLAAIQDAESKALGVTKEAVDAAEASFRDNSG